MPSLSCSGRRWGLRGSLANLAHPAGRPNRAHAFSGVGASYGTSNCSCSPGQYPDGQHTALYFAVHAALPTRSKAGFQLARMAPSRSLAAVPAGYLLANATGSYSDIRRVSALAKSLAGDAKRRTNTTKNVAGGRRRPRRGLWHLFSQTPACRLMLLNSATSSLADQARCRSTTVIR